MRLVPLPVHPPDLPWPTREWPTAPLPASADRAALERTLDSAFAPGAEEHIGATHAFLVVHRGAVVAERYGAEGAPEKTFLSWSMAKSVLHALVGILVRDGKLDVAAPADVPAWRAPDDPRRKITLQDLLQMSSGLRFLEDYVDRRSDVIEMLFGAGKEDVASFAAGFSLDAEPGTLWSYSSGTSNIVSGVVGRTLGGEAACRALLERELFGPIGMRSATVRFDAAGTFIGSSFVFATARDFARFGLLYLRDGVWEGRRVLPPGWVDHARTPAPASRGCYGAHWWLASDRLGTFAASGYAGQRLVLVPALDLLVLRLGQSKAEQYPAVLELVSGVVRAFGAGRDWPGLQVVEDRTRSLPKG